MHIITPHFSEFSIQFLICAVVVDQIQARPSFIVELGRAVFKSLTLEPNPEPLWVENGIIVLVRHNFAGGSVDSASPIKAESDLNDVSQVVLRRSPSTLRVIPAKLNALGKLDINFSKDFINSRND